MVEYYINNDLVNIVKGSALFNTLTEQQHIKLYDEVCNATLHSIDKSIVDLVNKKHIIDGNPTNSLLMAVVGICTTMPEGYIKIKNEGSYPDIDQDYSKLNRSKVIDYTKEQYGEDKVCQVVTFGTLGAKGAIRSSARALGYPVAEGDFVAKLVSNEPDITINAAIEGNATFKELMEQKQQPYYHIVEVAKKLEGLPNASGIHASALIVADKPIYEYVPLMISKKDNGGIATQFEYKDVEANFCIKWDYLGLKTLDVIHETAKLIKKYKNIDVNIREINVNDPSIYNLLNSGFNTGIFQFESSVFAAAVNKVRPKNIHDISAITSLNRPGPMQNGLLDQYIDAKNNGKLYTYGLNDSKLIAKVQEICADCYSIMAYQEYVIRCFAEIANFDEIESDNARRALGKFLPINMVTY